MGEMAMIESSGFGLRRASSSCFGPPPLLLQLVLASRGGAEGLGIGVQMIGKGQDGNREGVLVSERLRESGDDVEARETGEDGGVMRGRTGCLGEGELIEEHPDHERVQSIENVPLVDRQEGGDVASTTAPCGIKTQEQPSTSAQSDTQTSVPNTPPPQQQHAELQHRQTPPTQDLRNTKTYTVRKATQNDIRQFGDVERSAGEVFRLVGLDALADDEPMPQEVLRSYAAAGHVWVAVTDGFSDKFVSNGASNISDEAARGQGSEGSADPEGGTTAQEQQEEHASEDVVVGFLACFPIAHHHYDGEVLGTGGQGDEDTAHFHIAELSVHTAHQKRGLGRRLLAKMFEEIGRNPRVLASGSSLEPDDEEGQDEINDCEGPWEEVEAGENAAASIRRRRRGRRKVLVQGYSLTTYRHLVFNKRFYESVGFAELDADKIKGVVGKRGRELWDEEQTSILRKEMRCWMIRGL